MSAATEPETLVRYDGVSPGAGIWGYTQGNFLVAVPGRNAKESAILLNEPAGKYLIAESGLDDTPENRGTLVKAIGEAWYPVLVEAGGDIPSIVTVSRAFLDDHPEVVEAARRATR